MKILMIEDEAPIREMVKFALQNTRYVLLEAENCQQAERLIADHAPQLILLDWMLPRKNGVEFITQLKANAITRHLPIIMLTAKAEEDHKVKALETGADDYIVKPFSPKELIARINTVLRRGLVVSPSGVISFQDLRLNVDAQEVHVNHFKLPLSPMNYQLLYFFLKHQNQVYSRAQLLEYIWPGKLEIQDRTVDAQIRRLRNILKPFGYDQWIRTVRGGGYQFSGKL